MEGHHEDEEEEDEGAMLWSFQEALERQTVQIGASACGATAVVDVLKALGVHVSPEEADRCVQTRLRRNEAPLDDYLLSRSQAGATHAQLIGGAEAASGGKVAGRFFPLHPPRRVRLLRWLGRWIRSGAVPVATMNMQAGVAPGDEIPDAWHHQLVFGVSPGAGAAFMTNPLDVVSEAELLKRLCSDSVLLIRRDDVLQRLTPDCSPCGLPACGGDPRWESLEVEGQVRKVLEEEERNEQTTTHVVIPAAYSSGVTLFALRESESGRSLLDAADLPLM